MWRWKNQRRKDRLKKYAQTWSSKRADRGRVDTFAQFTQMLSAIDYCPSDKWQWFTQPKNLLRAEEYTLHQYIHRPDGKGKQRHVFRVGEGESELREKIEAVLRLLPPFEKGRKSNG